MDELEQGIYEAVRTVRLEQEIADLRGALLPHFADVDPADAPDVVAHHVAAVVRGAIAQESDAGRRVELTNRLLAALDAPGESLTGTLQQLTALTGTRGPDRPAPIRPVTPLSQAALLTNAKDEPSLSAELRAELASADRVDLLCAFIRVHPPARQSVAVSAQEWLRHGVRRQLQPVAVRVGRRP